MIVKVTYCSNYNGVNIEVDGNYVDAFADKTARFVVNKVTNFAGVECNKYGEFYGDIDELEEYATKLVKEEYGSDVEVIFEEDNIST